MVFFLRTSLLVLLKFNGVLTETGRNLVPSCTKSSLVARAMRHMQQNGITDMDPCEEKKKTPSLTQADWERHSLHENENFLVPHCRGTGSPVHSICPNLVQKERNPVSKITPFTGKPSTDMARKRRTCCWCHKVARKDTLAREEFNHQLANTFWHSSHVDLAKQDTFTWKGVG